MREGNRGKRLEARKCAKSDGQYKQPTHEERCGKGMITYMTRTAGRNTGKEKTSKIREENKERQKESTK